VPKASTDHSLTLFFVINGSTFCKVALNCPIANDGCPAAAVLVLNYSNKVGSLVVNALDLTANHSGKDLYYPCTRHLRLTALHVGNRDTSQN
jgi:hypothetical protein